MSDLTKIVGTFLQGITLAVCVWTAGYIWNLEHRLLRVEYALGIEKTPTLERSLTNGQR